jgi:hypothetical protein
MRSMERIAMTAIPKQVRWAAPWLLRSCFDHGAPCMRCGRVQLGGIVAAHSNWSDVGGKGSARKADDWAIAYLCFTCHNYVDFGGAADVRAEWLAASVRTFGWLLTNHLLVRGTGNDAGD